MKSPWDKPRNVRAHLRVSLLGVAIWSVAASMALGLSFLIWEDHSSRLVELDVRHAYLEDEVSLAKERNVWVRSYLRIYRGIDLVGGKQLSSSQKRRLGDDLWLMSRTYGFDPLLVLAMVSVESRGNPMAKGKLRSGTESGAIGLMQLKYGTASDVAKQMGIITASESDLLRPEVNLAIGTVYLLRLVARYRNLRHAVMAYNIGPWALDSRLRQRARLPEEYWQKVLRKYTELDRSLAL